MSSRRRPVRNQLQGDRGSESVELAILLPVAMLVLAMLVVGARIALAGDRMSGVAGTAARQASLARSLGDAELLAASAATEALTQRDLHCSDISVTVDAIAFAGTPGVVGSVTVDVSCTVRFSDVGIDGLPGARTLHDSASSPLDPARDVS